MWLIVRILLLHGAFVGQDCMAGALKPLANFEVQEMKTYTRDFKRYRAIVGYAEIYPFIVVEKIEQGATEGDADKLAQVWKLEKIPGGNSIQAGEGWRIGDLAWMRDELHFRNFTVGEPNPNSKECIAKGFTEGRPSVSCPK